MHRERRDRATSDFDNRPEARRLPIRYALGPPSPLRRRRMREGDNSFLERRDHYRDFPPDTISDFLLSWIVHERRASEPMQDGEGHEVWFDCDDAPQR